MLTELCQEIKNWFDIKRVTGTWAISGGVLNADFLLPGQYYRIMGSVFNDGVHCFGDYSDELVDETFDGSVWALGIPAAVINLAAEIAEWQKKYGAVDSAAMSPYTSESFGGYSYSKGGSSRSNGSGAASAGWKDVFSSRLNAWRKI